MARRGALTALQAVLAGISGGAGGYIQQEEMKRKQLAEKEAKEAREFDAMLGIRKSGLKRVQPGVQESGYESVGSFRGAEYAAPTPETQAKLDQEAAIAAARRANVARTTVANEEFQASLPELRKTLDALPKGLISPAERSLIESGQMTRPEIASLITSRTEASRRPRTDGGPNMANIRMAAVKNLTEQLGEAPTEEQVNDYVRLIVPSADAGTSKLSQARTFIRQLKDQGVSRDEAEKQVRQRFPDEADQILGRAPAAAAPLPTMNVRNEGFFGMPAMAPTAPMASAAPRAQGGDMEEIRALAARLAELNRGGRMGGIAAREEYARNAPERQRVQAALDEAQRRYRSR